MAAGGATPKGVGICRAFWSDVRMCPARTRVRRSLDAEPADCDLYEGGTTPLRSGSARGSRRLQGC